MWTVLFRVDHKNCFYSKPLSKYGLESYVYFIHKYYKKNEFRSIGLAIFKEVNDNVKNFVEEINSDSRVIKVHNEGNMYYVLAKGNDDVALGIDKDFLMLKPAFFKDGFEYWNFSSLSKKKIQEFCKKIGTISDINIISLKESTPKVVIYNAKPDIKIDQKEAFKLARLEGYYDFPRKISLKDLAKKYNIARTTFSSHLRKAEKKILSEIVLN